jgi:hypothetical protein
VKVLSEETPVATRRSYLYHIRNGKIYHYLRKLIINIAILWRGAHFNIGHQPGECMIIRTRLLNMMAVAFERLRPGMMLQPSCLMCGKSLTDPVSMARWVGPECAGTSSTAVLYTFLLSTEDAAD